MNKIPKILHYCWFGGGELNPLGVACKASWERYFSDYEFIEWNENNTDLSEPILSYAYRKKQWAFVSDYVRLVALYQNGGVYLDVDMEVIKDFSPLINKYEFIVGEERVGYINAAVIGTVKKSPIILACIDELVNNFEKGSEFVEIPRLITPVIQKRINDSVLIAPPHYFYPYNPYDSSRSTKQLLYSDIKKDTYSIHHYQKSWKFSFIDRVKKKIRRLVKKI